MPEVRHPPTAAVLVARTWTSAFVKHWLLGQWAKTKFIINHKNVINSYRSFINQCH